MRHPFEWLSIPVQKTVFIVILIITLFMIFGSFLLNAPLTTTDAPAGIISYELAYKLDNARRIVSSWKCTGKLYAGIILGLDYLFIVAFVLTLGLGCILAARVFSQKIKVLFFIGIILSWMQLGAGLLDCIENVALIQVLLGSKLSFWPVIAFFSAVLKFTIAGIGLLYMIIGFFTVILSKILR